MLVPFSFQITFVAIFSSFLTFKTHSGAQTSGVHVSDEKYFAMLERKIGLYFRQTYVSIASTR